jgi:hypothetical protein
VLCFGQRMIAEKLQTFPRLTPTARARSDRIKGGKSLVDYGHRGRNKRTPPLLPGSRLRQYKSEHR